MIRVVVADDHPVVRGGLVALLAEASDLEVVGQAADGEELVRVAGELLPDVVLTDLRMPRVGGAEATRRILARHPATRVLVLTTYDSDADILAATEAGATGYLLKASPPLEIFAAVRAVARGERAMAPSVARALAERQAAPSAALSAREREVLALMRQGATNAAIGRQLFIGEATVKSHVQSIFAKLGVRDRTSAVAVGIERGLV
ncbi:response regulator transcription factor [Agrococcus carbonis]|uniref:DNA-binding response regulator, NarL/FixJ family, contains REC and HTH domains n=1 Tax=Agrococcus carbonis TaxID=684552 RepID=A0A1H1MM57_9MICO|nr:response regulator transcription factor [Agrococcus carbonis]SDR87943.1 DNA-binding response regulator, NarL/FixJ family, contains REC and HTH domains [Agrococcus carbonis]